MSVAVPYWLHRAVQVCEQAKTDSEALSTLWRERKELLESLKADAAVVWRHRPMILARASYVARRTLAEGLMRVAEAIEPDAVVAAQWFEISEPWNGKGDPPPVRRYCPRCRREVAGTVDHSNWSLRPPKKCIFCEWKPRSVLEVLAAEHG